MKNIFVSVTATAVLWSCAAEKDLSRDVTYPPGGYREVRLAVTDSGTNLENFPALLIEELGKRGISTVIDSKAPRLVVRVTKFDKESAASRVGKWIVGLSVPTPGVIQTTSNAIELRIFFEQGGETTEFEEFRQFKETARDWEELKRVVASRVADALYFHSPPTARR